MENDKMVYGLWSVVYGYYRVKNIPNKNLPAGKASQFFVIMLKSR